MGVTACVQRPRGQPKRRWAYSWCCCESPRPFMSKTRPGALSALRPWWAKMSPRGVFPMPVAPYTPASVPGSSPPPSISSSFPIAVETREVTSAIVREPGGTIKSKGVERVEERGGGLAAEAGVEGAIRGPLLAHQRDCQHSRLALLGAGVDNRVLHRLAGLDPEPAGQELAA